MSALTFLCPSTDMSAWFMLNESNQEVYIQTHSSTAAIMYKGQHKAPNLKLKSLIILDLYEAHYPVAEDAVREAATVISLYDSRVRTREAPACEDDVPFAGGRGPYKSC